MDSINEEKSRKERGTRFFPHWTVRLKRALFLLLPLAIGGAFLPSFLNTYIIGSVLFLFAIYSVLALSYDILGGFAGYMNLGHVVFFGIGAYVAAILFQKFSMPLALGISAAPVAVACFAFLFSFPLFRLKGFYFAVAGLAFVELANLVVASMNAASITNGFNGIAFVQYDVVVPYYAALALVIFSILLSLVISDSKLGLALRSIREDEEVAESIGINVPRVKRLALLLSGGIAGLDGAVYFWGRGEISPSTAFGFGIVFVPVTLALMGGTGTILGPILGGAIYIYLQYYGISFLQSYVPGMIYFPNAVTGIILVIVGLFVPRGIVGSPRIRSLFRRLYAEMTE
ncbi:MAG: branched-chain amino acid ABC transporter permease [Thaumarchaeota archaeon]|nr:branched-chain amino acid ABC transporter permease [Nitrososphaerota archaeon]